MVTLDEGADGELTHSGLGHPRQSNLTFARAPFYLRYRKVSQRGYLSPFRRVREKVSRPHRMPQATTMMYVCANPEMTEHLPIDIGQLSPITGGLGLQIRRWRNPLFIYKLPIIEAG